MRGKKTGRKKSGKKKVLRRKLARKKAPKITRARGTAVDVEIATVEPSGRGPRTGGQSGDIQALPTLEESGPESVRELAEEGQDYEAELISGVESVPDADQGEIRPRGMRENNFPPKSSEYE